MRNLTKSAVDPDIIELKQVLDGLRSGIDNDLDVIQDAITALNRDPPKVSTAKKVLEQALESMKKKLDTAKAKQVKILGRL